MPIVILIGVIVWIAFILQENSPLLQTTELYISDTLFRILNKHAINVEFNCEKITYNNQEYSNEEEIETFFQQDFKKAQDGALRLLNGAVVKPEAYGILTEMVYQMGEKGVGNFKKTLDFLKAGEYKKASEEMLKGASEGTVSNWALQTPDRAYEASNIILSLQDK